MDFSEWVRLNRGEKRWDLRAVEAKSGVDNSTVARIETGHSQATLVSAIRLWQAYDVPFSKFASDLGILFSLGSLPTPANPKDQLCLSVGDILGFLNTALTNEKKTKNFVDQWLDRFNAYQHQFGTTTPLQDISVEKFWDSSFDFPYPPDITSDQLSQIFENGEALTFVDAGYYMALLRQNVGMRLVDLEKKLKISDTVLGRVERGAITNVKIKELIQINNCLDKTGLFFALYWVAGIQTVQLKTIIAKHSSRREAQQLWPAEQATYNLIKFHRWFWNNQQLLSEFISSLRNL